jgi:hypothetical protein
VETSFPAVHTQTLFLTALISGLEGTKVVTVNIPGAFMQTDVDELINVKLEDELVDLLVVDSGHDDFVMEGGVVRDFTGESVVLEGVVFFSGQRAWV